ncbi:MAG: DUF2357 domain-containing protein [Fluviicoccus sp.]|uniref:DUF2357 domain-containing protein n=1 Tax=Fluviicoccus sp. TaxID=2003552 RepID=UPI00271CB3BB|nr:DUF2357 domain-containing protein [Fluviicoccus sp.]MDO8331078.1 DUF2357 domain-containing protein [Fluviicoccus sp.]
MTTMESLDFCNEAGQAIARLKIYAFSQGSSSTVASLIRTDDLEARENGEEPLQLLEGCRYEFEFEPHCFSLSIANADNGCIIETSHLSGRRHTGFLATGLNTGRLALVAKTELPDGPTGKAAVEVRSRKVSYREDYRIMLEDITDQCMDLLLQLRAPTSLRLVPDAGSTPQTITQRFAFLKAIIGSENFQNALRRISSHPHQCWEPEEVEVSIRHGVKQDGRTLRQLASSTNRESLPNSHPLKSRIASLPRRITVYRHTRSEDTPENRFIKFALETFDSFLGQMLQRLNEIGSQDARLREDIASLQNHLENALGTDLMRSVSKPDFLPLGSPVLQRKEGYREIYQAWIRFDMAARLIWHGGDDVYHAGQRDIATLYEYWVFFKLLDVFSGVFQLEKPEINELIEETEDGFSLKLRSGKHLCFDGFSTQHGRQLRAQLGYNRTFSHKSPQTTILPSSWTERMRPDYTLSIWPGEFSATEAEAQELMVHIHFDAKYRIDNFKQLFGVDDSELAEDALEQDLAVEKQEQKRGSYKRADLLKMHAYRDAIRRSHGAYIIYPGDMSKQWTSYHELLPGLGAFPLKPGTQTTELSDFIHAIVRHLCNRANARERLSYHVDQIYHSQDQAAHYEVLQPIPERLNEGNRLPPPSETHVLVGWYKTNEHLQWVLKNKLYNFRMDSSRGSLRLPREVAGAQYLLLHTDKGVTCPTLLKISADGPRVFSRERLIEKAYPGKPSQPFYLVFDVEPAHGFEGYHWDYLKLPERAAGRNSATPQWLTLDVLMQSTR